MHIGSNFYRKSYRAVLNLQSVLVIIVSFYFATGVCLYADKK